jgi:hypothetical protein
MVRDLSPSSKSVCTAEPGGSLSISGEGSCGNFDRVLVSDNIRENIIYVSRFADQGINSLFTIMANRCQLATPLWSEKLRRVDWRDTDLMKEVGKNINKATRTSSVSLSRLFGVPKVWDNVVLCLLPLWSPIGVVVVLNFQLLFSEEELSPAPKG